jgi:hypothetical protein
MRYRVPLDEGMYFNASALRIVTVADEYAQFIDRFFASVSRSPWWKTAWRLA